MLSLIVCSCASIKAPDVPVCKELSPQEAYCAWTISNKSIVVDDVNKYEDKTWWEHRPYLISLFPSTYEKIKATMVKICTQFQQNCEENDVQGLIKRLDEVVAYKKPLAVEPEKPVQNEQKAAYPTKGWDDRYNVMVRENLLKSALLDVSPDRMNFCPKWVQLNKEQRVIEFAKYLRGIAVYESAITLNSRMVETTMGIDPITGMQVASEGLFQLSYQDAKNYEGCKEIDYKKDKGLDGKDLKRSIFQPEIQFKCTIYIMDRIMKKRSTEKAIGEGSYGLGRYWSVVRTNKKANDIKNKMIEYKSNCF